MSQRLLGGVLLVGLCASLVVYGANGAVRVWQMKQEIRNLEREIAALRAQSERLARSVERLQNDPAYVEKLAREELGLVRKGETILKFPSQSQ